MWFVNMEGYLGFGSIIIMGSDDHNICPPVKTAIPVSYHSGSFPLYS